MKERIIIAALFTLILGKAFAQGNFPSFWNSEMKTLANPGSTPDWVKLKPNNQANPYTFFSKNKKAFQLRDEDNLVLIKSESDNLGFSHLKHHQTYKGVKVEGGEFILHVKDNNIELANGKIIIGLNLETSPSITKEQAIEIATNNAKAKQYGWEVKGPDGKFLSAYPAPELIISRGIEDKNYTPENFRLAYKMEIYSIEPYSREYVFVDAITGKVLKKHNLIRNCSCCYGTAATLFNGSQTITTSIESGNYILKDKCRGNGIYTYFFNNPLTDSDNNWSAPNERPATSAHWAAGKAYDYYLFTYGRDSFDGNGTRLGILTQNNNYGQDGAIWNDPYIIIGTGNGGKTNNPAVSTDVIGHEFTHGVSDYTAGLGYTGDAGALGESFADIFGTMVEFYAEGSTGNYSIGEDMYIAGSLRDLSNPNLRGHPDTYGTTQFYNSAEHEKAGVQNFWFYLLSEGGNGTNDLGYYYAVLGIGKDKAAKIAYRNLTTYLHSNSSYIESRNGSIQAAIDIFGICSEEVRQTINAWSAVGISIGYYQNDINIDCSELNTNHASQPYGKHALNSITSSCAITPNGQLVSFIAGNWINLTNGFSSGDNFFAYIDPCVLDCWICRQTPSGHEVSTESHRHEESFTTQEVKIYPNPSKNQFTIEGLSGIAYSLFNYQGEKVKSGIIKNERVSVNTQNLKSGLYFLHLQRQGKIEKHQIIIE